MGGIGDITLIQYVLVATVALFAGVLGGIAGYGSGVLVLAVLGLMIDVQVAVPVISAAALLSNASRVWVFWKECDIRKALIIMTCAMPTTALGAWWFASLSGSSALVLIGTVLVLLVPVRRYLAHLEWRLDDPKLAVAAVGYGLLNGSVSGTGVMLLSLLMWAGLTGTAVIGTDALVTIVLVTVKSLTFYSNGLLPLSSILLAVLIGMMGMPGSLIARWLSSHLSLKQHTAILDGVVILAGLAMVRRGLLAT